MNLYFGIQIAPYRIDFCNALSERYGYAIFHLEESVDLGFNQAWVAGEVRYEDHRYPKPGWGIRTWRLFRALLRQYQPDTVMASEFSLTTLWMLLFSRFGKRRFRVVSLCDDSMDMIRGNDFSFRHRLARRIVPFFLDNLILPSEDTQDWYRRHFGKGVCMPIIADDIRFRTLLHEALPEARRLSARWNLAGIRVILFVGRQVAVKNVSSLIQAVSGLQMPHRLMIVGDGPFREQWEELSASLHADVVFVGAQSGLDLAAYYQLADLFVLPSVREPFGAVVNEALLAGVPVIVSSRAGSRSLVNPDNGRIVEPSAEEIASALAEMLATVPARSAYEMRPSLMKVPFQSWLAAVMNAL